MYLGGGAVFSTLGHASLNMRCISGKDIESCGKVLDCPVLYLLEAITENWHKGEGKMKKMCLVIGAVSVFLIDQEHLTDTFTGWQHLKAHTSLCAT